MGGLSIVWYVGPDAVSENILFDSIAALGLMIAFYYGLTGFACTIYYRRELFRSAKTFLLIGRRPAAGRHDPVRDLHQVLRGPLAAGELGVGHSWFGVGPPLVIGLGFLVMGLVLMLFWRVRHPAFFQRKPEVADPRLLERT